MVTKRIRRNEQYKLKGGLKKNGFDRWRLVTSGINVVTGEEKTFFIEFYVLNPLVSPKEPVLGFKNRLDKSEDYQFTLAGTSAAKSMASQIFVTPSFFMIRAGILSENGRQLNAYYPCEDIQIERKKTIIGLKKEKYTNCVLAENYTAGSISVSEADLLEHPEYMGNAGSMSWNLRFTKKISFAPDYRSKEINWCVAGGKTDFTGTIIYDKAEYSVSPKCSFGYYDKNWGRDFSSPFFHLSSSNLISGITGNLLEDSSFAVQGEYKNRLSVLVYIDGRNVEFHADSFRKYKIDYNCIETPEDENGTRLHWSVSVDANRYVIDIDIFCDTKQMFLRKYESPEGRRKVMSVLSSGIGTGKISIYKKRKKDLELLEQADVKKCICEYGSLEYPET